MFFLVLNYEVLVSRKGSGSERDLVRSFFSGGSEKEDQILFLRKGAGSDRILFKKELDTHWCTVTQTKMHFSYFLVSKHSKFGIINEDFQDTLEVLLPHKDKIKITGLHCHLGSTIEDVTIYSVLFEKLDQVINY